MKKTHIEITTLQQIYKTGLIIKFKDKDKKIYHTYLPNTEIAQLAKELNEILTYNLYGIIDKIEEE